MRQQDNSRAVTLSERSLPFRKTLPSGQVGQGACQVHLPTTAQELADVLGRERALYLIGQLPVCYVKDKRWKPRANSKGSRRVILYVPKRLRPDHRLVAILGWNDAQRLVDAFGGEILCPPTLHDVVYKPFRDAALAQLGRAVPASMLAEWFGLKETRVRQTPQEGITAANDDDPPQDQRRAG
jgi:hypothetical protein